MKKIALVNQRLLNLRKYEHYHSQCFLNQMNASFPMPFAIAGPSRFFRLTSHCKRTRNKDALPFLK
jgi:hypothetical protein